VLPKSLKSIKLGICFKHAIVKGCLPRSIKLITLCGSADKTSLIPEDFRKFILFNT
jgi:hypothetical protein